MSVIFVDIETFHDFYYLGMKREEDGKRIGVEYSTRSPEWDRDWVRNIFLRNTTVGYNSLGYDLPMIWYSLQDGVTNEMLKAASDRIIKGGIKWWEVEEALGIRIPWDVKKRHIDLIEIHHDIAEMLVAIGLACRPLRAPSTHAICAFQRQRGAVAVQVVTRCWREAQQQAVAGVDDGLEAEGLFRGQWQALHGGCATTGHGPS